MYLGPFLMGLISSKTRLQTASQCWAVGAEGCYNITVSRRHTPAKLDHSAKNDKLIRCQINVGPASLTADKQALG